MSAENDFLKEPLQTIKKHLAEWTTTTLGLLCLGLAAKYGDQIFDTILSVLGKQKLLLLGTLILTSWAYLAWKFAMNRKLKSENTRIDAEHKTAITELQELKKKHAEIVRISQGVEFRKGDRTLDSWMPFCPNCHVVLHVKHGFGEVRCPANCGWVSVIHGDEIWKILRQAEEK